MTVALAICVVPAHADSINIVATGTIPSGCTVGKTSDFASANLTNAGTISAGALVDCNTPFLIRSTSAKGAVKTAAAAPVGFANSVPYTYTLSVGVQGNGGPASVGCTSAQMLANNCTLSSGSKTANNQAGTLTVSWTPPVAPTMLVAGAYFDTITLSIAPAP